MAGIDRRKPGKAGISPRQALLDRERGGFLKKWTGRLPVALVYPNTYQVGMSSLGFQLVYSLLNEEEAVVCERFFLPSAGKSLRSIESDRPLGHFSLIFISISFEHDYQHLVAMLLAAGIEPWAEKRDPVISADSPLLVCGGVVAFMNPEPLAPFVDLFVVGEAEPVLPQLMRALAAGLSGSASRRDLLRSINRDLSGCYAPLLYSPRYDERGRFAGFDRPAGLPPRIRKASLSACAVAGHSQLLTPEAEFADLYLTELGRGCSRGCRFCTAGFVYRPPRLWDVAAVIRGLEARDASVRRIGLLGMEMADPAALDQIADHIGLNGCALSFSSLRADRISRPLLQLLGRSGLKSVAIAPDGSSERLRRVINKNISEDDLLQAAEQLVTAGLFKLKIYLMIGLPTETDDDLREFLALVVRIKERIDPIGRSRGRLCEIRISVNCFAPKPWTPFQYHPFGLSEPLPPGEHGDARQVVAELRRRQELLRAGITGLANVHLTHDRPEQVLFQALLAKGDRRLAAVLLDMVTNRSPWKKAMARQQLEVEQFVICGHDETSVFPWDILDHGIGRGYLWREYRKAFAEKTSPPCDTAICRRCGVCHGI
ncbi:MAG: radical SAM protein [Desulfoprunum sp.]|uniref:radical SAM protein n=1 Tax=Desulfoprunum sp. TaxID=2020866 RepID=UPI003C7317F5